jgi:glycosyltransferase involved in cell wall biosynthesis
MRLRVGLNALHLVPGETGGSEIYARSLIPALALADRELGLVVFAGREAEPALRAEPWADSVRVMRLPVSARSRSRRVLAEQVLLGIAARRAGIGLLHNLFTTAPALPGVPQVTTIHDLIYRRYPEAHAGLLDRGLALLVPLAARRSRRLIAVSQATRTDIVEFLSVPPERVDVTYEGPGMAEVEAPVPEQELRRRFELGDAPLLLTVSAKRPHKNLERLFAAFAQLEAEHPPILVVPGYPTVFEQNLRSRAAATSAGARIRFTGWVDDATLDGLYRAASCFVFPSLAEGFGLPVLEAMIRGAPVACSNATSLPEVAGDAALYFDPMDTRAIAQAVRQILEDGDLRERLRRAGFEQARRFSWEGTARATLESYERALAAA